MLRLRQPIQIALWAMPIVACGGKSSASLTAEHERSLVSWEQTVRLVGEAWLANDIPSAYARRTLDTTLEELDKQDHTIASDRLTPSERLTLSRMLAHDREITGALLAAVAAGDRDGAARAIQLTKQTGLRGSSGLAPAR